MMMRGSCRVRSFSAELKTFTASTAVPWNGPANTLAVSTETSSENSMVYDDDVKEAEPADVESLSVNKEVSSDALDSSGPMPLEKSETDEYESLKVPNTNCSNEEGKYIFTAKTDSSCPADEILSVQEDQEAEIAKLKKIEDWCKLRCASAKTTTAVPLCIDLTGEYTDEEIDNVPCKNPQPKAQILHTSCLYSMIKKPSILTRDLNVMKQRKRLIKAPDPRPCFGCTWCGPDSRMCDGDGNERLCPICKLLQCKGWLRWVNETAGKIIFVDPNKNRHPSIRAFLSDSTQFIRNEIELMSVEEHSAVFAKLFAIDEKGEANKKVKHGFQAEWRHLRCKATNFPSNQRCCPREYKGGNRKNGISEGTASPRIVTGASCTVFDSSFSQTAQLYSIRENPEQASLPLVDLFLPRHSHLSFEANDAGPGIVLKEVDSQPDPYEIKQLMDKTVLKMPCDECALKKLGAVSLRNSSGLLISCLLFDRDKASEFSITFEIVRLATEPSWQRKGYATHCLKSFMVLLSQNFPHERIFIQASVLKRKNAEAFYKNAGFSRGTFTGLSSPKYGGSDCIAYHFELNGRKKTKNAVMICKKSCAPRRKYEILSSRAVAGTDTSSSQKQPPRPLSNANLKPLLKVGSPVFAAWWHDEESRRLHSRCSWYPGTIKSVGEKNGAGDYGPIRLYDIEYDDGDELGAVEDRFVFPAFDYMLETEREQTWIGVQHVCDEKSEDNWAKQTGWYTANIDGEKHPFPLLSEALRAYDEAVVRQKGSETKKYDLNLPEESEFSCQQEEHSLTYPNSGHRESALSGSDFIGCHLSRNRKRYETRLKHGGKNHYLGCYNLQSDAALAYDKALKHINGPNANTNFATVQEYIEARAKESRNAGKEVDLSEIRAYMSTKLDHFITKALALEGGNPTIDCCSSPTDEKKRFRDDETLRVKVHKPSAQGLPLKQVYRKIKLGKISGYPVVVTQGKAEHSAILTECDNNPHEFLRQHSTGDVEVRWESTRCNKRVPAESVTLAQTVSALPPVRKVAEKYLFTRRMKKKVRMRSTAGLEDKNVSPAKNNGNACTECHAEHPKIEVFCCSRYSKLVFKAIDVMDPNISVVESKDSDAIKDMQDGNPIKNKQDWSKLGWISLRTSPCQLGCYLVFQRVNVAAASTRTFDIARLNLKDNEQSYAYATLCLHVLTTLLRKNFPHDKIIVRAAVFKRDWAESFYKKAGFVKGIPMGLSLGRYCGYLDCTTFHLTVQSIAVDGASKKRIEVAHQNDVAAPVRKLAKVTMQSIAVDGASKKRIEVAHQNDVAAPVRKLAKVTNSAAGTARASVSTDKEKRMSVDYNTDDFAWEENYHYLYDYYIKPVPRVNDELPSGMIVRRTEALPSLIRSKNSEFRHSLYKKIKDLERLGQRKEIYRMLKMLSDHDSKCNVGGDDGPKGLMEEILPLRPPDVEISDDPFDSSTDEEAVLQRDIDYCSISDDSTNEHADDVSLVIENSLSRSNGSKNEPRPEICSSTQALTATSTTDKARTESSNTSHDPGKVQKLAELLEKQPEPEDEQDMQSWMLNLISVAESQEGLSTSSAPSSTFSTPATTEVKDGSNLKRGEWLGGMQCLHSV